LAILIVVGEVDTATFVLVFWKGVLVPKPATPHKDEDYRQYPEVLGGLEFGHLDSRIWIDLGATS
jgi:hypothetical protein